MGKEIKDGGHAFPIDRISGENGMSLRQYFAAHAPEAHPRWIAEEFNKVPSGHSLPKIKTLIAKWRYEYADEMIKEGERCHTK